MREGSELFMRVGPEFFIAEGFDEFTNAESISARVEGVVDQLWGGRRGFIHAVHCSYLGLEEKYSPMKEGSTNRLSIPTATSGS